ncbi:MAG: winged helix-turn-helix domain-containing protein [Granulosicoccus sp.]
MAQSPPVTFAGCYFSSALNDVILSDGTRAGLRRQTANVFHYLAQNCDRVVSRQELFDNVWGKVSVTDDSLTKCISEIRGVLSDSERDLLKTFPKRGYQLIQDEKVESSRLDNKQSIEGSDALPDASKEHNKSARKSTVSVTVSTSRWPRSVLLALLPLSAVLAYLFWSPPDNDEVDQTNISANTSGTQSDGFPHLVLKETFVPLSADSKNTLLPELRVALGRYRTVKLADDDISDLELRIQTQLVTGRLTAELIHRETDSLLYAESYKYDPTAEDSSDNPENAVQLANRIAAAIAAPGIGAIDTYLLESTKNIKPEELSRAACYAYGFGCSKCSGEEDNITPRAEACLAAILEKDPNDARAWALQATIYAHQYWWANTLPEPERSDPSLRTHLPEKAIVAANKAEALSDGYDTSVYWGMAEAYFAACESDKLKSVIDRGLEINPYDPNLLGAFGNWLSYSGKWDEGAALTLKALDIESRRYQKWWWMGPAKASYFKEDFNSAYAYFLKAFNERNWMSHLQLAYTLPHLGRVEEARKSVATLQYMWCF